MQAFIMMALSCDAHPCTRLACTFEHGDENFQCIIGDAMYTDAEIFILHRIAVNEHPPDVSHNVIDAFNKMYAIQGSCGVGL